MLTSFRDSEGFPLPLLDRLRDDYPHERVEAPGDLTCSWQEYRRAILRDIQWLLNTTSIRLTEEGTTLKEVAASTLHYGVPEVCGSGAATLPQRHWERELERSLARFEPRLREDSIGVRLCVQDSGQTANQLVVEISAELLIEPIPLLFRVRIDRETSAVEVQDLSARAA